MKSVESKIPHFYDVLDEELERSSHIEELFWAAAREHGFTRMRTTAMELRDRYLSATQVSPSRIFEVRRVKEGSRYALQADLAMSMSRFVADLPSAPPLKLAQISTLYRDRQPNLPGYRREFQQALLGTWGVRSPHADAELIALGHRILQEIPGIRAEYIQLANHNLFNAIRPGLAERVRFDGLGIGEVLAGVEELSSGDRRLLAALFAEERMPVDAFVRACTDAEHPGLRDEVRTVARVAQWLEPMLPGTEVSFSLSHIHGTGHYSGMNYQIFATAPAAPVPFLIGDGGRIDQLCRLMNRNDLPAVCMGLGLTVLAQLMAPLPRAQRIAILADVEEQKTAAERAAEIRGLLASHGMHCAVLPLPRRKWASVMRNEQYDEHAFVLIDGARTSVRHRSEEGRVLIDNLLKAMMV
ncbi:ATP phosphoribosyltransferase regulatory subunit [[Kitasatospora] papulosa]|uniref:ATP phosphoribosyltransferase regulatory subunit n=1 Tax=[Kitasatospora] papulosa TaxID=1464011 RepID=UPI0036959369